MNSGNLEEMKALVTKRDDANYSQVSGYIPKDLALRLKIACATQEITQSEALENAIAYWLDEGERVAAEKAKSKRKSS